MPAWNTYKKMAQERGALALELYVVESIADADEDTLKSVLPRHLDYQQELEARGELFLAGPLSDVTGQYMQGCGLIIYRCDSFEHALKLAEGDPMHSEKARTFTLRRWLVNEGSLQFSTKLSSQSVKLT